MAEAMTVIYFQSHELFSVWFTSSWNKILFIFPGVNKVQAVREHWKNEVFVARVKGRVILREYAVSIL